MSETPIKHLESLLPELKKALATESCIILQSPPGTGKTTRVPLALLDAKYLQGLKILMLEPRRLAAKSAAQYMAKLLGEKVGQTVGYRVRLETKVSAQTRIEVVTEGILTRMLQSDQALEEVGLVIFDEFHERSLQADLGLALCLESQQILRDDLKLLIMSATLNSEALKDLLNAPVFTSQGRQFPVENRYAPAPPNLWQSKHTANIIRKTLTQESGSFLVFLPGAREIRQVAENLQDLASEQIWITPLFGNLSPQEQERAIQPAPKGIRKIVLATNIAETSLTIEGIRVVIDSGQERSPRFDPISGMTELKTQVISKASAEQRRGRAGRLEPGICIRLWPEADLNRMANDTEPEILSADLSPLALELACWGCTEPNELQWLNPPPEKTFAQAIKLLQDLQALDQDGQISPHGKALAQLPLHPRLAHMLLQAQNENLGGLACTVAALLEERDILAGQSRECDLILRLEALSGKRKAPPGRKERLLKSAANIGQKLHLKPAFQPQNELAYLLGLAYPERIAQRRNGNEPRFLLAGGRGAFLDRSDALADAPYVSIAQLDGNPREARIFLAATLSEEQLERLSKTAQKTELDVAFNPKTGSVQAREVLSYGALELSSKVIQNPDATIMVQALCVGIRQQGLNKLNWSKALLGLRQRVNFIHQLNPTEWPALDDETLTDRLEDWLAPFLSGIKKLEAIDTDCLQQGLNYHLGYAKLRQIDDLVPSHFTVPSGSSIRLDYSSGEPVLAVRLQEIFGLLETPKIAQKMPILIHLLSPAQRPVQVTRDLASFWAETYPQVKKELKGRYPKHYWPDDPYTAEAIRGVVRRKS